MLKQDPYTGMDYICVYSNEEDAEQSAEAQMLAAPVHGFFTLLLTGITWLIFKICDYYIMEDEYKKAMEKGPSQPIQALDARFKKRGTGVREKFIEENGKWVKVDV